MTRRMLLLSISLLLLSGWVAYDGIRPRHGWEKKAFIERPNRMAELAAVPNEVTGWPPELEKPFPRISLFDHEGKPFSIETLRGKPTLVELVAMTCAACQAWSGAHERGTFDDLAAQQDLLSIERYFKRFTGGLDLFDGSIHFVQLVVYNTELKPPTPADLALWRKHFGLDEHSHAHVVSGGAPLANGVTFVRTPGFLLLDADLVYRYGVLGPGSNKPHDLYRELLPAVPELVRAGPS